MVWHQGVLEYLQSRVKSREAAKGVFHGIAKRRAENIRTAGASDGYAIVACKGAERRLLGALGQGQMVDASRFVVVPRCPVVLAHCSVFLFVD